MDELGFRMWLSSQGMSQKQIKDNCSRLKSIEKTLLPYYDIDLEYTKNKCVEILRFFNDKGALFKVYCENITLPIGQYYLSSYKLALRKYIKYLDSLNANMK